MRDDLVCVVTTDEITFWSAPTATVLQTLPTDRKFVSAACLKDEHYALWTASEDEVLLLWDDVSQNPPKRKTPTEKKKVFVGEGEGKWVFYVGLC